MVALAVSAITRLLAFGLVAATCRIRDNPPFSVALISGLTHTQYPVTCGNHITKWHYCYHTDTATPGSTMSMTVAVWSWDAATAYILCPSSIRTITLQPVQTQAKIFCVVKFLTETKHYNIITWKCNMCGFTFKQSYSYSKIQCKL